jgi:hypothetical protein
MWEGMILLVTASDRAQECATALQIPTAQSTQCAKNLYEALGLLRSSEYVAVILDQCLLDADPEDAPHTATPWHSDSGSCKLRTLRYRPGRSGGLCCAEAPRNRSQQGPQVCRSSIAQRIARTAYCCPAELRPPAGDVRPASNCPRENCCDRRKSPGSGKSHRGKGGARDQSLTPAETSTLLERSTGTAKPCTYPCLLISLQ